MLDQIFQKLRSSVKNNSSARRRSERSAISTSSRDFRDLLRVFHHIHFRRGRRFFIQRCSQQANLSGEFKDQFTKQSIDGNRLASLTEFDVDNFIASKKKKQEMKSYIIRIKKPTNTLSKPNWIATAPPPTATNKKQYNDDSDDDSIYSWGDDFDEVDEDNGENNAASSSEDDENYIDVHQDMPPSINEGHYNVHEENNDTAENLPGSGNFSLSSLKVALLEFQANRGKSPSRADTTDEDTNADDDYLDPVQKVKLEPTEGPTKPPGRRQPPKIPEPEDRSSRPKAKTPLLPGQGPLPPPNTGKNKGARKTKGPSTPKNRSPSPIQAVYEDPDASAPQQIKRRPPPPIPNEDEPPQDIYINDKQISQQQKLPEQEGGYIKFQPPVVQEQVYIEPEEPEQAPDILAPPIPPTSQARRPSLPPVPVKSQGATSNGQDDELEALYSYNWYHSESDRGLAELRLKEEKVNGMYLVRKSLRGGLVHPYTLMVYYGGRTYNFPIRRQEDDHQFGLGKDSSLKRNGLIFPSVEKLISYFQTHPLILNPNSNTGSKTMLTKPLTKL
ncbi:B-cell linker protein isoform X4 [Patella vulgata]|uniref:B-cell linker protein isoform X4 n=1 Tax=Patella vulgata TaxID=6465 RepID=UPI0024A81830|nr:B-cell linker protein isoform X4 [Patella vulgata]